MATENMHSEDGVVYRLENENVTTWLVAAHALIRMERERDLWQRTCWELATELAGLRAPIGAPEVVAALYIRDAERRVIASIAEGGGVEYGLQP